ncbi:phenylpropionate dioxygenase-like ring-hydroxylating dioxygenase large terminal subunit [Virgibacillus halotolerans]|uniref:Rieske 2Fe-2S domain-containing protein n=1 Tax=Virgibacillus halotolerans TaxID=1071053 RepID=UPI00195F83A4|nr:Rieske 2Fe-2S domain-containing protein [Virgibacillus halotolerans]MBM7599222.1 phenylpropionate dioxygenase-like ring-hydroxylating dioxygenase large terminal subunit [Virgibacillus halotolerans]
MLSKADNQLLTQTDSGTPMGDLFRRYWIPVANSEELIADGKPQRIRLLGEDLVAFRDTKGDVGLVDERCPHRGTSLYYGINDGCGLRCMYHGWKFDTNGDCVEIPSEEEDGKFRKSIKLKNYPIQEAGGVIWTYMGPAEAEPPLPDFHWLGLSRENKLIERVWQECNYAQAMENDLDFVHAAFLHRAHGEQELTSEGVLSSDLGIDPDHPLVKNPPVKQAVQDTNYGKRCVAVGIGNETENAFMEIHYIFPFYTYPPRFAGEDGMWHAFIPRDDNSTWVWDVQFSHDREIDVQAQHDRRGLTLDEDLRKYKNLENEYDQDRLLQKEGNFTGIRGIANQDHAATETMGPIVDRSIERLGTSDLPVIQMRRLLLRQVKAFQKDQEPMQLENASLRTLLSEGLYDDNQKTWQEAFPLKERFEKKKEVKS